MEFSKTMRLKDKIRERLIETIEGADKKNLEYAMISISSIPIDKHNSPTVIQNVLGDLKSNYTLGDIVNLDEDLKDRPDMIRSKIRFAEYIGRLSSQPASARGLACEGMMAGIFGGVSHRDESSKTDITINGKNYQVKSAEGTSWDSGSLLTEFNSAVKEMEDDGRIDEWYEHIGVVDGVVRNNDKKELNSWKVRPEHLAYSSDDWNDYKDIMYGSSTNDIDWLFLHLINGSNIVNYWLVEGSTLLGLLKNNSAVTLGRKRSNDIRIGTGPIKANGIKGQIIFPTITNEDLMTQIYHGDGSTSTGSLIRRILNPEKPYKVNQTTVNYITDLVNNGNIDSVMTDLKNLSVIKNELEHDHPITEEQIKEFKILVEDIRDRHIFTNKLPVRIDNELYILSNKLGGLEHRDIVNFGEKATEDDIHMMGRLLDMFPSTLEDLINYTGNFDLLRNSKEYRRIVNFIKVGGLSESDVFGQGLLNPIDPEEFEGEDEEWEKLMSDVVDEPEKEPEYDYQGGKTDPEIGFVAPSNEVTDNICSVEGICEEQGPITFGQLKSLVEEATSKRIMGDMGRGVFKTLWRIIPFFIPQVLLASVGITVTRAINKIVTPALKDTKGYKSWWGKVVLKAMDVAEGDYIPDVAIGDDPLSKIFFISDGLFQMITDKYKLKFARYVAEIASTMGEKEPVPEWFVDNLLRDYLNQKFLLNPPLQSRDGLIGNDVGNIQEVINIWLDEDYDMVIGESILFKDKTSKCVLKGQEIIERINKTFSNGTDKYLKYISTKDLSMLSEAEDYETFSFRRLHKDGIIDDNLNVPTATLINYLDKHHRKGLESLAGKVLPIVKQDCFDGKLFTSTCEAAVNIFNGEVLKIENNLFKFGFIKVNNGYMPYTYNDWLDNLIKDIDNDFYIKYNDELAWLDMKGDVDDLMEHKNKFKEHVEVGDLIELLYLDDPYADIPLRTKGIVLEIEKTPWGKKLNVRWMTGVEPYGWRTFSLLPESGDLWRKVDKYSLDSDITDRWDAEKIIDFETNEYDGYQYADERQPGRRRDYGVNEEIIGQMGNTSLVRAYYDAKGGWGTPPKRFSLMIMPSGKILDINVSQYTNKRDIPFELGDIVSLGKLIKFENESDYELRVKGRFGESRLNESVAKFDMSKMTPRLWKLVKSVIKVSKINRELTYPGKVDLKNIGGTYSVQHVKDMGIHFVSHIMKYSDLSTYEAAILYLIVVHNINEYPEKDIIDLSWEDVKLPTLHDVELEYYQGHDEIDEYEECVNGYGEHSGEDCDCGEWEEITIEDKDGNEQKIPCDELDYNQLESLGMDEDDCECDEYHSNTFTKYYYPKTRTSFYCIGEPQIEEDVDFNMGDMPFYTYENDNTFDDEYEDWFTVDEFYGEVAEREGKVTWVDETENPPISYIPHINKQFYNETNRIVEQEGEQTSLFPLGVWLFPDYMPKITQSEIDGKIHKSMIKHIFKKWNQGDFDMSKFRHLGIESYDTVLVIELLKRWVHTVNTEPILVEHIYDCYDLTDMFDPDADGYEDVKKYLCNGIIDRDDLYYDSEWDNYMFDYVNEVNIKYIAEILGVPEGSVDNVLSKSSDDEWVENYIEENEDIIDEVRYAITNSFDREYGNATYRDIEDGIDETLAAHFQEIGSIVRGDDGVVNWVIKDDLRNVLTLDTWEDESLLALLSDSVGGLTLYEFMEDMTLSHTTPNTIFGIIMDAEFKFEDYGTGTRGDSLQNESKVYDSRYHPDVKQNYLNEILSEELGNLDWEGWSHWDHEGKVLDTISEQGGETGNDSVPEQDLIDIEKKSGGDGKPFTKMEAKLMNKLHNSMTMDDIETVANNNIHNIPHPMGPQYFKTVKMYGFVSNDEFSEESAQRFAKWIVDNREEAKRVKEINLGDDFDPTITYNIDFGLVTEPVKRVMKVYDVELSEVGYERVSRKGTIELAAWDEDDAQEVGEQFFYDYGGETDWVDGGDYEIDDSDANVTGSALRVVEQRKNMKVGLIAESIFNDVKKLTKISKNTSTKKLGDYYSRGDVMKFLDHLQNAGLVNMYQSVDFLWSGKDWLRKYLDLNHPELLISVQDGCVEDDGWNVDDYGNAENNADMRCDDVKYLFDNADKVRDVIIILSITKLERESSSLEGTAVERQLRPISQDMVRFWMSLKS